MADERPSVEWRIIPDFPNYEVSSVGQVRRRVRWQHLPAGRPLVHCWWRRKRTKRDGSVTVAERPCVMFYVAKQRRNLMVHQLVAAAFLGPRPSAKHQVAHNDGNPKNNSVRNLRWALQASNEADRLLHGTSNQGGRHGMAKLTECKVAQIKQLLANGSSCSEVGAMFDVSRRTINHIKTGTRWKHI
jgi:hypothetical protein